VNLKQLTTWTSLNFMIILSGIVICLNVGGCLSSNYNLWRARAGTQPEQVNAIMEDDYIIFRQEYFDELMGLDK